MSHLNDRNASRWKLQMQGAPLVCPPAAGTPIPFDIIDFDGLNEFVGGPPVRIESRRTGYYFVSAHADVLPSLGNGEVQLTIESTAPNLNIFDSIQYIAASDNWLRISGVLYCIAGSPVYVRVWNLTALNLNIGNAVNATQFMGHRLS